MIHQIKMNKYQRIRVRKLLFELEKDGLDNKKFLNYK